MEFDPSPFHGLQRSSAITRTAYARLTLGSVLPKQVARCIYLDCDLVVQRDIVDLWETDLQDFALGAVDNALWDDPRSYQRRLGLKNPSYFNSGVLLVDVDRWRAERIGKRALEFAQKAGDLLILHDQDALNGSPGRGVATPGRSMESLGGAPEPEVRLRRGVPLHGCAKTLACRL